MVVVAAVAVAAVELFSTFVSLHFGSFGSFVV